MTSVPVMNGNTIIIPFPTMHAAWDFTILAKLTQFAVREIPEGYSLSTPVTPALEAVIPGILHGARARAKPEKPKPPTGGGSKPDGTPPNGGTPGNTSIYEHTFTEASAA